MKENNKTLLILADIHGNSKAISAILTDIEKENEEIDYIIIAGDLPQTTPFTLMLFYILKNRNLSREKYSKWVYKGSGREKFINYQIKSIKKILKQLTEICSKIIYVPGNIDTIDSLSFLKSNYKDNLIILDSGKAKDIDNFLFWGTGGSLVHVSQDGKPICDFEFTEESYDSRIDTSSLKSRQAESPYIIITHELPNFSFISKKYGEISAGSTTLSHIDRQFKPLMHIFGHYHELSINQKNDHNTHYINPGPAVGYHYAIGYFSNHNTKVILKRAKRKVLDWSYFIYKSRLPESDNKIDFQIKSI